MKLYLLDAYALIYRAYYALIRSPRINSKGRNTSAIFGFVNTIEEILRKERPDLIAIAFDPAGPTFRHEAYPEYKAQREATPEDIKESVPIIKDLIRAYGIPLLEVAGFEADDVIGTMAHRAADEGMDVYMITPDKDYAQLVGPHVWMQRPGHGAQPWEVLGVKEVCEKYGFNEPHQMIDYLALMGDASDNIPGCPNVGPKTAAKLIQQFGSVENLLARTNELKGEVPDDHTHRRAPRRAARRLAPRGDRRGAPAPIIRRPGVSHLPAKTFRRAFLFGCSRAVRPLFVAGTSG